MIFWLGRDTTGTGEISEGESTTAAIAPSPNKPAETVGIQQGDTGLTGVPPLPTEIISPSPIVLPTMTSSPLPPSATPQTYILLFARRGEDSLLIANRSSSPFPLGQLRIGDGRGAITGSEWGVDSLQPGACVIAWKDRGKPKLPDVECEKVEPYLTRSGSERFWVETFNVYYADALVARCLENEGRCEITMTALQ
jgi:hypothetical protein